MWWLPNKVSWLKRKKRLRSQHSLEIKSSKSSSSNKRRVWITWKPSPLEPENSRQPSTKWAKKRSSSKWCSNSARCMTRCSSKLLLRTKISRKPSCGMCLTRIQRFRRECKSTWLGCKLKWKLGPLSEVIREPENQTHWNLRVSEVEAFGPKSDRSLFINGRTYLNANNSRPERKLWTWGNFEITSVPDNTK